MADASPALLWLRNDLRRDDNPALAAAARHPGRLAILHLPEDGDGAAGGAVRWWLHHALAALDSDLRRNGQHLVLKPGAAADVVPELVRKAGIQTVFWNRRHGPDGAGDETVAAALRDAGVAVETFPANLLVEPAEIAGSEGGPVRVYGAFRRRVLALDPEARSPVPAPRHLPPPLEELAGDPLERFALLPTRPDWAGGLRAAWTPGEAGAEARLDALRDGGLAGYAEERDLPAVAATSQLSPHLRFGEISPRRILAALAGLDGADAAKFRDELLWREFAWHVLGHVPEMGRDNLRPEFDAFPWAEPTPGDLAAWQHGTTGYPIVDAGMRELWHTGWMHNRVRMIVASFLTKHLLVDWRIGEAWFRDTLVDADAASNPFNWQWVAGSGYDAQPYFRIFNPVLQGEKFDADGAYVRRWVPELADVPDRFVHKPWTGPDEARPAGYPAPIVDHAFARQRALAAFEEMRRAAGA
ncbi:MAG: deoxyribodipyrimidine photo-lyase [Rhizobiales bacterium]|nr:deoxyribodipyrimidine photo-lyase [Hyphomicrobiales bacterium]